MNREYDAIYVHGQGYAHRKGRDVEPSIRGRLEASAFKSLINRGYSFKHVLFSGIVLEGESISSADLHAKAVQGKSGIDESIISKDEKARTTSHEVSFARNQAVENGWNKVAHLTYGEVQPSHVAQLVKRQYGNKGIEVDVLRADELLAAPESVRTPQQKRDFLRYKAFISIYNKSISVQNILNYERKKDYFMGWPLDFGNKLLNIASVFHRPDPSN